METIGAEATLTWTEQGVVKKRAPKNYRHPELDAKLRTRRTKAEARILEKARALIAVPHVTVLDNETLLLEEIPGVQVKEVLDAQPHLAEQIGSMVRKLHDANIIHGDLTTSNMLYKDDITFIDFGLSFISRRDEDKAVDIHLFKQALAKHQAVFQKAYAAFLHGYGPSPVLERLQKVEARGKNKHA